MPFNINTGVYTPPAGATNAATGQVIQSAVWNTIHADLSTALTTVLQQLYQTADFENIMAPNGGFQIWQRAAGGATASISVAQSSTVYTADRWYLATGASQACVVAAHAGLTGSGITPHAAQIARTTGQTGTVALTFGYPLDTDEVNRLRGNQVSFQFEAATGANWSPTNGVFTAALYVGTGAVAKRGAGFTNEATVVLVSATLAAGASGKTFSGQSTNAVPVTSTQGELQFVWTPTGTAGAADNIVLDQCALTLGNSVLLPYVDIPFDVCLQMCKRHYQKTFPYSIAPAQAATIAGALEAIVPVANAAVGNDWHFPVAMRAVPAITTYDPVAATANWHNLTTGATVTATADATVASPDRVFIWSATVAAASNLLAIQAQADAGI